MNWCSACLAPTAWRSTRVDAAPHPARNLPIPSPSSRTIPLKDPSTRVALMSGCSRCEGSALAPSPSTPMNATAAAAHSCACSRSCRQPSGHGAWEAGCRLRASTGLVAHGHAACTQHAATQTGSPLLSGQQAGRGRGGSGSGGLGGSGWAGGGTEHNGLGWGRGACYGSHTLR